MTRLEALEALAREVEAGNVSRNISRDLIWAAFGRDLMVNCEPIGRVIDMILDPEDMRAIGACAALHEAVLPGWGAIIHLSGRVIVFENVITDEYTAFVKTNQARALLLAILKALIAREQTEGDE